MPDPSDKDNELREIELSFNEVKSGSDRVCAIVAAALLDESLENAIRDRFRDLEKLYRDDEEVENKKYLAEISKSLNINNFLGTTNSKITIAYLLGIVGNEGKDNLLAIASIRNHFAHRQHVRSFDDDRLKQLFQRITAHHKVPSIVRAGLHTGGKYAPFPESANRRERFTRAVSILLVEIRFRSFDDSIAMHDPPRF